MKVVIVSKRMGVNAKGDYNVESNELTVKIGSIVSDRVVASPTFKTDTIVELRKSNTKNNVVTKDITFKSPSTAANFVCGNSTNGLRRWKTEDGKCIKEMQ